MNDSVLVIVGYSGGYGGSFFTKLLENALSLKDEEIVPINDKNEFQFDTGVLGSLRYQINGITKAYDKEDGFYGNHHARLSGSWGDSLRNTYEKLYHPDRKVFLENLTKHIRESLRLKPGFNVINAHYFKKIGGFSIYNVHDKVVFFLLAAEDQKHRALFELIGEIKHNPQYFSDEFFNRDALYQIQNPPELIKPFDSCVLIEVGKLFLEYNEKNVAETEEIISKALDVKVSLDKNLLFDYYESNIKVLNDFLNTDVEKASLHVIAKSAKKKLESLL